MNRLYLSAEDVSEAILEAGIQLRPEDCLTTKFRRIAERLSDKLRKQARREVEEFTRKLTRDSQPRVGS